MKMFTYTGMAQYGIISIVFKITIYAKIIVLR